MMYDKMNNVLKEEPFSLIRKFTAMAKEVPDCRFLTLGEPDFSTDETIKDSAKRALDRNLTHYSVNAGMLELRQKIADWEREKHGLDYRAEEVIVTAGATEALMTAIRGIVNPGDEVIIPTPAFGLYASLVRLSYGVPVMVSTAEDGFQLTREKLLGAMTEKTKAVILNSPNNPTGVLYTEETLQMIHDVVKEKDIFVICDEVYNQLVYADCPALTSYADLKDRMLIVQSYSKPYAMTGWRMGYLLADRPLAEKFTILHAYTVVSVPTFLQSACIDALDTEPVKMVETYRRRRDYVYGQLIDMGLEAVKPEGAFYVFPSIEKYGLSSMDFCVKMLKEAKIAVVPGIAFGCDTHMRISYCCSDENLQEGMKRIRAFLKTLD